MKIFIEETYSKCTSKVSKALDDAFSRNKVKLAIFSVGVILGYVAHMVLTDPTGAALRGAMRVF